MISICIIGSGNIAHHLINAFLENSNINLVQVFSRNLSIENSSFDREKITNNWSQLADADVYIIAVSDDAINYVSQQIPYTNKLVVHTSGAIGIENLDNKNRKGVFYPLQTFTKNKPVDFKSIPICLETSIPTDYEILEKLARMISEKNFAINSEQRKALHVSAVFVCNFVNHLYKIGNDICSQNHIPFEILLPLIQETAEKIKYLAPTETQTGPAKRNDFGTIAAHKLFLKSKHLQNIYEIMTLSIQENG